MSVTGFSLDQVLGQAPYQISSSDGSQVPESIASLGLTEVKTSLVREISSAEPNSSYTTGAFGQAVSASASLSPPSNVIEPGIEFKFDDFSA